MEESELDPEIAALLSNVGTSYNAGEALSSVEETEIDTSKTTVTLDHHLTLFIQ